MTKKTRNLGGRPKALSAKDELRAAALYVSGRSASAIADELGVTAATIRGVLRRHGVRKSDRLDDSTRKRPDLRKRYAEVGPPPPDGDPLNQVAWGHSLLVVAAERIATDPNYAGTEEQREAALIKTIQTMSSTMPKATLARAVKIIKGDRKALGKKKGPEVERVSGRRRPRTRGSKK